MATPKPLPSGVLLERLWCRYQQAWKDDFAGATPPSKRTMSKHLGADEHALARWTNDKAHQGGRDGYRIPLRRVLEVCAVLKATDAERDDIMAARLVELQDSKDGMDVLVLLSWLEPVMSELAQRPLLDSQQRQLLAALDRARASVPCWAQTTGGSTVPPQIETSLARWLQQAQTDYLHELQAEPPVTEEEHRQMQERARAAIRRIAKPRVVSPAQPPTEAQTRAVVRSVREAIRGAGRHLPTTTVTTEGDHA